MCYQRSIKGPFRAEGGEKQKNGSDHFQLVMPSSRGTWRNKGCLSEQCCSRLCALVLRWLWMLTPELAGQAAGLNLTPLSPTADPCILGAGGLNPFPAKPLSVKQRSFMYLHHQHPRCWETAVARHPSRPRGSFQCLARAGSAGWSLPHSVWGSQRQCRALCVATHYVIGTAILKTPHASKNKSIFYCLDEQRQPFGFRNSQVAPQEQDLAS